MADLVKDTIIPLILCGGSGTRLWPASRETYPKQFISLFGGLSTFQATLQRVANRTAFSEPVILASHDVRFIAAEQMAAIGINGTIILEPMRRDSAAAVAVAATYVAEKSPDAIVLILAADHLVEEIEIFEADCLSAAKGARLGHIMTLGIKPRYPATSYGYIKPGKAVEGTDVFLIDRFLEKPDATKAAALIAEGCLWNSGNFLFQASIMLSELETFAPDIPHAARAALKTASTDLDFIRLDADAFGKSPQISIDYAVMERTDRAAVLPASFTWSDIGTWGSLWEASKHDENGNALHGNIEIASVTNSVVQSDHILTSVIGMDGVVVVASQDAVLVTTRERSGEVKDFVAQLRRAGRKEADEHLRMHRPWGWYQRTDIGDRFQVKRIMVKPSARLSLQKHFHRAEHWVVVRGTAEVTVDGTVTILHENEAIYLPIGSVHRLANPGRIPLEIIEVQVGSYTGEDDIVRIEDVYGR